MFSRNPNGPSGTPSTGQVPLSGPASHTPAKTRLPSDRVVQSVIGSDLSIMGDQIKIISRGSLQIDAQIHGDLHCVELIVGEQGRVKGTVAAESVIVRGQIDGAIRGQRVVLESSARVNGDVYHGVLSIEQGATFDGTSRRPKNPQELMPDLGTAEPR